MTALQVMKTFTSPWPTESFSLPSQTRSTWSPSSQEWQWLRSVFLFCLVPRRLCFRQSKARLWTNWFLRL